MIHIRYLIYALSLCILPGLALSQEEAPTVQYIHTAHLIDVPTGEDLGEYTVVVEDGIITDIQQGYVKPASDNISVIDLRDHYLLPGLMDMHVHLEHELSPSRYLEKVTDNMEEIAFNSVVFAKRTLMAGFTTVRDLGGKGVNIALRDAINDGKVVGPRVYTSGKTISTTGGHQDPTNSWIRPFMGDPQPVDGVANGPWEMAKAVRQRYKNGADCIKVTATGGVLSTAKDGKSPHFLDVELEAVVQTANDYNMHTAAHAHGAEGMKRAVEAGITSIEHGTMMTEEIMDLMIEKGTWLVPTITAGKEVAMRAEEPGYYPAIVVPKAREVGPQIQSTFKKAYERGVPIAFGTDAGVFPHGENAREFIYMHEVGMPMPEALYTATVNAAKLLGIEDQTGIIEKGKWADFIAVKSNPLESPEALQEVDFVMKEERSIN